MLSHDVFFTLKDPSPASQKRLVDACKKYLRQHPGVVAFSVGTLEPELARPVNDRDFHVALHVAFKDRASHDLYQKAPTHVQFATEYKEMWSKVRVFDSICETA
jgi:hypothetical protein